MGNVHPLFTEIVSAHLHRAPLSHATTVQGVDGEAVEVCGRCCGLGRVGDAPCECEAGDPGREDNVAGV